ncbi:MAG: ThuA domain-containing protein [Herpetosiphonaceae bacterium]|nr:ThuA domain-containing protein [Herpetosiphonaceae bacterium]
MAKGQGSQVRTLVLCGDRWHPPQTARTGLEMLKDDRFVFDWIENAEEWSADRMSKAGVVMLTKSNDVSATDPRPWATKQVQEAFRDYVRAGNGLLIIHSGSAGYAEMPVLRSLTGGTFLRHPSQCPVTVEPRPGHPLSAESTPFTAVDEHYMMALDDGQADVFLSTTSEHGSQPGGWIRTEGQGRVCVLTPGHNLEVWLNPAYQTLLGNALDWCAGLH